MTSTLLPTLLVQISNKDLVLSVKSSELEQYRNHLALAIPDPVAIEAIMEYIDKQIDILLLGIPFKKPFEEMSVFLPSLSFSTSNGRLDVNLRIIVQRFMTE